MASNDPQDLRHKHKKILTWFSNITILEGELYDGYGEVLVGQLLLDPDLLDVPLLGIEVFQLVDHLSGLQFEAILWLFP